MIRDHPSRRSQARSARWRREARERCSAAFCRRCRIPRGTAPSGGRSSVAPLRLVLETYWPAHPSACIRGANADDICSGSIECKDAMCIGSVFLVSDSEDCIWERHACVGVHDTAADSGSRRRSPKRAARQAARGAELSPARFHHRSSRGSIDGRSRFELLSVMRKRGNARIRSHHVTARRSSVNPAV